MDGGCRTVSQARLPPERLRRSAVLGARAWAVTVVSSGCVRALSTGSWVPPWPLTRSGRGLIDSVPTCAAESARNVRDVSPSDACSAVGFEIVSEPSAAQPAVATRPALPTLASLFRHFTRCSTLPMRNVSTKALRPVRVTPEPESSAAEWHNIASSGQRGKHSRVRELFPRENNRLSFHWPFDAPGGNGRYGSHSNSRERPCGCDRFPWW